MKLKSLALTLLGIHLLSAPAMAWGKLGFKDLDSNKDSKVSQEEMQKMAIDRFIAVDKNKDKVITLAEVLGMMPFFVRDKAKPKVTEYLKIRDQNGDGQVSFAEISIFSKARFKALDRNNDGFLSSTEFQKGPF